MRLEHICDMELVYREESLYGGTFLVVRPYGGEGGTQDELATVALPKPKLR